MLRYISLLKITRFRFVNICIFFYYTCVDINHTCANAYLNYFFRVDFLYLLRSLFFFLTCIF
ncbi:hypothetical protein HanXRQr2_Chr15g0679111 [Helianthus annuus]|uniref:Uncharacterized protein n=1 Tax=Helianthus annuus TaxID=4232 RepID=A0A9K3DY98_HELAN|nr:hypothetical protein HanXRQr2_Chr15g0679111 [Helianthus annuus]